MPKRKIKRRTGQGTRTAPRTAAQYFARPARQREALLKTAHVLTAMRMEGVSLRSAAREHRVSPATVQRHAGAALRKTPSGTYKARASDKMLRVLVLPRHDGLVEIATRDSRSATMAGEYSNAVQTFLQTGDDTELQHFRGQHITDAEGKSVQLLTDLDELERLGAAGVLSFESLYARAS
jgi:lambda repressor-like predicted transcriptional regulator